MEVKLEPCPFCGGKAYLYGGYGSGIYIACLDCDCKVGFVNSEDGDDGGIFNNKEDAIKAWNTRPHPQREALDEEKVYHVLKEWQYDSDEEFVRGQAKAICAKFKSPSLEDLLSALPGKECPVVHISIKEQYYCSHCERAAGYNEAIAALKGLWK